MKMTMRQPNLLDHLRRKLVATLAAAGLAWFTANSLAAAAPPGSIRWWVSSADFQQQLAEQPPLEWRAELDAEAQRIEINPTVTFQTLLGVDRAKEKNPQERDFIRDHLGPPFRRHGLQTRSWCYDHNGCG